MNKLLLHRLAVAAAVCMALALQLQPTVHIQGHLVRFCLGDLFLVPAFVLAIIVLYKCPRALPLPCLYWACALCVVLAISYFQGVDTIGSPTNWAIIKLIGGFVVLGYFVTGSAIAILGGPHAKSSFALIFVFAVGISVFAYLLMLLASQWLSDSIHVDPRFSGMIGNRNAAGLLLLVALCLAVSFAAAIDQLLVPHSSLLLIFLIVVGLILTASAAAWVGGTVCLLLLAIFRVVEAQKLFLTILMGFGFVLALSTLNPQMRAQLDHSLQKFVVITNALRITDSTKLAPKDVDAVRESAQNISVAPRLNTNREAIKLWLESPLTGKGLGYVLAMQKDDGAYGENLVQVHNTLLWLLAEMGLVGLGIFVGFLVCVIFSLNMMINDDDGEGLNQARSFAVAMLILCISWQVMSLVHELMFQRHVWFGLGLALGERLRHQV